MPINLPTDYQSFIHKSRYARWLDTEKRRETWEESVDRYIDYLYTKGLDKNNGREIREAILNLDIMGSMRALMTAGPALERDNTAGFNCSYLAIDDVKSFDEAMFILLCGTGVGFSVERQYINKLPEVPDLLFPSETIVVVKDSKEGWSKAYRQLLALLWSGEIPRWDVSKIRPSGARLKTFGGRASGPAPLEDLFRFTINTFKTAKGRKLNSLECHDLLCKIGEIVVVGGVRRSAMISLSNLSDDRLRYAKSGQWWEQHPYRALSNNSVAYTEKPSMEAFLREWTSLVESKSGERGIFSREASKKQVAKNGRRDANYDFGTNPCSEIILRSNQFCNLTEVVIREDDTKESLLRKVRLATILGTVQSTLTYFPYLRKIWAKNTEEERLLGVSLTGIYDNKMMSSVDVGDFLEELKQEAVKTNAEYAKKLGIEPSTAITCVKPSGTVSQLVNSASGIHPRHSNYYIRTVRADNKDPLSKFMAEQGVPFESDVMRPDNTLVFSFPVKSPDGLTNRANLTALEHLNLWKIYQEHWCEHKPSITVNVKEDEWLEVAAFVYKNFDDISGISFLPYSEHTYQQAPYQEITREEYEELVEKFPKNLDWLKLSEYEEDDNTSGSQTFACVGSCEIVDIT